MTLAADSYGTSDAKNSKLTFTSDAFGDVTSVDNHGGETGGTAGAPHVVLNAEFDANGNRTVLDAVIAGTADFHNAYGYDYLDRQSSIIQQSVSDGHAVAYKKTTFAYYADSRLSSLTDYTASTTALLQGHINGTGLISRAFAVVVNI